MADRTQWIMEASFGERGQRENSYVVTNGSIESTATNTFDYWDPALTYANLVMTQATTLIALYNNDNILPSPQPPFYPNTALGRPIIVDEIGVKIIRDSNSNFNFYQFVANVMWVDQGTFDIDTWFGTCSTYPVANFQAAQFANAFANRLQWSPDRLYNASVGPAEMPNEIPAGYGPNAIVAYADADAEKIDTGCVRPLVPIVDDGTECNGVWRPPKNSVIIDPGQAITVHLYGLQVPPVGFTGAGAAINATGRPSIAAWIRFRQPVRTEIPYVLQQRTDVI